MKVVLKGEQSQETHVDPREPQGTVLGPLLFLVHINDLPTRVKSQVRLFTDDCLLYRTIKTARDHITLQEDLSALQIWAQDWGMRFNARKRYILSINNKSKYFYALDNTTLKQVSTNPYLGMVTSHRKHRQQSKLHTWPTKKKSKVLPQRVETDRLPGHDPEY